VPLHHPKENQKRKKNKINIKSEKLNKRKENLSVSKVFYNIEILLSNLVFFLPLEIATMQQTDGTTHKLKPRLFHKFPHL